MNEPINVHGTGLLLGSSGVLLRGPSGAGKSVLALSLLDRWDMRGLPAFLVSDDRVDLRAGDGQVIMQAPANLAGLIELRGRGIVSRSHHANVPLDLVIDLVPHMVRMLEDADLTTDICGIAVSRAPVPDSSVISLGHQMLLVIEALSARDTP